MSTEPSRGKRCPGCGRIAPAEASLCPMCFRHIEDVEVTEVSAPTGVLAVVRARASAAVGAAQRHPRTSIAVAAVIVIAVFAYVRYFRPAAPLPVASSTLAAVATDDAWPTADGGAGAARATTAWPPLGGALAWARTLSAPAVTAPVVDGDAIYVGLADGRIAALDARDGSERWSLPVPGQIDSAPVVAGGTLYLAHRSGRVVAVDTTTGEDRWAVNVRSPVFASPVVADGVLYVASFETLVGVDAATGEVMWRRSLDAGFIQIAPAVAGDHLLVATNAGVRFFDRRTGVEHYDFALRDAAHISGSAGIAIATQQTVYAFDPDTQTPWWWGIRGAWANFYVLGLAPEVPAPPRRWAVSFPPGGYAPVVGGDAVFVAHPGGAVTALDAVTGAERWRRELAPIVAAPVLTGAGLLAATADALIVIDPATGDVVGRHPLGGLAGVSGLAVTDGVIVLQTGPERDGLAVIS